MDPTIALPSLPSSRALSRLEDRLRAATQALEAGFLAQMLDVAGVGAAPEAFGGGAGETQFASFLREAQAREMARAGGIGLAEAIYESLLDRTDG